MSERARRCLPQARAARRGLRPGRAFRIARRVTQCVGLAAVLLAPLLGGWQRLERNQLATWSGPGWTLPQALSTRLPRGETARRAHDANKLIGGGLGIEYVGLPAADPLAGGLALLHARGQVRTLLAWLLPALVALVAGRWFCGWLCPFGALARGMSWLFDTIWPRRYRLALPRTRPVRYIVLAATIVASLLGTQLVLFTVLPHFLLQQSVYAAWLLGGGSSVLGVFVGLLVAVALMGPTSYCAAVCPTGATLALLGRKRRVHLTVSSPSRCGAHCRLCNEACWLQLDAASGDPGPDCDVCGRCVPVCPRTNLELRLGAVRSTEPLAGTATARGSGAARAGSAARGRSAVVVGLCLAASCVAMPGPAQAQHGHAKPKLLLDSEVAIAQGGLTVEISEQPLVSQPNPLGQGGTAVVPNSEVTVEQGRGSLHHLKATASLSELVSALNALGADPRDLLAIFQALRRAGALQAEIEVQ